jgi:hypothetical protein
VDPILAPIAVAPESAATANTQVAPWLEQHIGDCVAAAACVVLRALDENKDDGKLTPRTRGDGGDRIFELYRLHQFLVGRLDFDSVARQRGTEALQTACGAELSPTAIDALVDEVLRILHEVVRATVN